MPPPGTYGSVPAGQQPYVFPTSYQDNDPIRRPCIGSGVAGRNGEDVCNDDGALGLVVPVPSLDFVSSQYPGLTAYPATPVCDGGVIAADPPRVFLCGVRGSGTYRTGLCPNNDAPQNFVCYIPVGIGPSGPTSQCRATNAILPGCYTGPCGRDGRVYNLHAFDGTGTNASGNAHYLKVPKPGATNGATMDFVGAFARVHESETVPTGLASCQNPSAPAQLACLVHADRCSIGLGDGTVPVSDVSDLRVNQATP